MTNTENFTRHLMCKAKRVSDSKWVTGFYIPPKIFPVEGGIVRPPIDIRPETLCRSVGRSDCTGKLLFERDQIAALPNGGSFHVRGVIEWDENHEKWVFKCKAISNPKKILSVDLADTIAIACEGNTLD